MPSHSTSPSERTGSFQEGARSGFPILIGYFPIAMAFGMLAKATGVSLVESILFSAIVFAGASQFMALNLLALGTGAWEIVLTTFLVNFRHFLMSASLSAKLEKSSRPWLPLIAFGVTDETFSVAALREGSLSPGFMAGLELVAYGSWVTGTLAGHLLGSALPPALQAAMGVALYGMFIALVAPQAKKSRRIAFLVALSGGINAFLETFTPLPSGWSIVVAILLSSAAGLTFMEKEAPLS